MVVSRYVGALALVVGLGVAGPGLETEVATSGSEVMSSASLSSAQRHLVGFGLSRFEQQGLELPELSFEFRLSAVDCLGHKGLFFLRSQTVRMCSMDKKTMLHELAHAWANHNLSDAEMNEFAGHRGLREWNDPADPWKERATEHAAEVIAWALMDRAVHLRLSVASDVECHKSEFRLLTIEDSTVERLHDGFVRLTGLEPVLRTPSELDSQALEAEWQPTVGTITSPEVRRVSVSDPHWEPDPFDGCI